jgi:hypothetical protein
MADTLVATPEPALDRVRLDVTVAGGYSYVTVERSNDGGVTFHVFAADVPVIAAVTLYDYAAPPSTPVLYRLHTERIRRDPPVYSAPIAVTVPGRELATERNDDA